MIISNAKGTQKDFEPDPALDENRDLDGRIVGFFHAGLHQKEIWANDKRTGEFKEEEKLMVLIEAVEEDTYVERGGEGNKVMTPRVYTRYYKFSSHEKSNLFSLAKLANPESVTKENGGTVDLAKAVNQPIWFKSIVNGDFTNAEEVTAVPTKLKSTIGECKNTPFIYSVHSGAHLGSLSDVPAWYLRHALTKALDAEEFGQLEEIEAHLAEIDSQKGSNTSGSSLEGDAKPAETKKKKAPAKKKAAEIVEEEAPEEEEAPKPARRARKKKEDDSEADEYADLDEAALEDLLIDKGVSDDEIDALSDTADSDEEYLAALKAKLKSL